MKLIYRHNSIGRAEQIRIELDTTVLQSGEYAILDCDRCPDDISQLHLPSYSEHIASTAYKGKRAAEYPPIADYMDAVVKGDVAQQQAYIDACLAVKARWPKP